MPSTRAPLPLFERSCANRDVLRGDCGTCIQFLKMQARERSARRVTLSLRVPVAHAEAVARYAETLTRMTRLNVTASAAGAAILEAGLVALGLIAVSEPTLTAATTPKRAAPAAKKGARRKARKP
jgi:hypothetical protein